MGTFMSEVHKGVFFDDKRVRIDSKYVLLKADQATKRAGSFLSNHQTDGYLSYCTP